MNKIYILLCLLFGSIVIYAQNMPIYNINTIDTNLTQQSVQAFNNLAFRGIHSLYFYDSIETRFENNDPIKKIKIGNLNGLNLFRAYNESLIDVELLIISWKDNDEYIFESNLSEKVPNLKYIYINSYDELTTEKVELILKNLISQFPNGVVIFETLINA